MDPYKLIINSNGSSYIYKDPSIIIKIINNI